MNSRLNPCLLVSLLLVASAGTLHADPLARCRAWLFAGPVDAKDHFDARALGREWTTATREVLGTDPATRPWWELKKTSPAGAITNDAGATADLELRLSLLQTDLPRLRADQVALSQVIRGEDAIRHHVLDIAQRARQPVAPAAPSARGFRAGSFAVDAWRTLFYGSVSSLLYVVGIEAAYSHRWISLTLAMATGVIASQRAQAYVTRAFFNIKNRSGVSRTAPVALERLVEAEAEHAERILNILDEDGGRTTGYLGFDLPVPLAIGRAGKLSKRVAPTGAQLNVENVWPADPRRLAFDEILYFDHLRREPVLLILVRESAYPQDPR